MSKDNLNDFKKENEKFERSDAKSPPAKPAQSSTSGDAGQKQKEKRPRKAKDGKTRTPVHGVRLVLGVLVGYLAPCIALLICVLALALNQGVFSTVRWLDIIFIVLILLVAVLTQFYFYGWLHHCMMALMEHHSLGMRILGAFVGGIGYILQPFVLIAYGPNKKWLYFLLVGLPSLILSGVYLLNFFGVLPFDAVWHFGAVKISLQECSLYIAIAFLLNALLALCTRRCKRCGCMMTTIVHQVDELDRKDYSRIETMSTNGDNVAVGKYYVCDNCRSVTKGIGFEVQTDKVYR